MDKLAEREFIQDALVRIHLEMSLTDDLQFKLRLVNARAKLEKAERELVKGE